MRENSYWPDLCLIQIADANEAAAAVDPEAPGIDLTPLLDLMVDNEEVLKVFHAGGQDLEIVHNLTGKTPHPLFDTQVAAMALGMGEQVGYSNLVEGWLGVKLDKGARFTDWARRPLDKRQLEYAIGDGTHLVKIFPKMLNRLHKTGRGEWLDQEMERLGNPASYVNNPDEAWQRLRVPTRKADVLERPRALAAWREREAQAKDLPRGRIAKDETLADLAGHPPARAGRSRQGARAFRRLGDERDRQAAAGGAGRCPAPDRRGDARPRGPQAWPRQGRRAGGGSAEAAAEDPRAGYRCRAEANRAHRRSGAARRRQARRHPLPHRLAI